MEIEYQFPNVDRQSYKPIYIQVSEIIVDYAKSLGLGPGNALPSENALLANMDVSRNTIRQAMERLVQMGYAVKIRGQGTFIRERKETAVNLDIKQGFEGSLHELGLQVDNEVVERRSLERAVEWFPGLPAVKSEKTALIRRLKLSEGEILALEERALPQHVLDRYTDEELRKENINPNLLERYPDTVTLKLRYYFATHQLGGAEARLLGMKKGTPLLVRIGEYWNQAGECFMLSRYIFISQKVNVSYEFEKAEDSWKLT